MTPAKKRVNKPVKATDETAVVRCVAGVGVIREEVWKNAAGHVVRYNLAFINFNLFAGDNGRVLGYDTAHGHLHRHFEGTTEQIDPVPYNLVFERFIAEVGALRTRRIE